MKQNIQLQALQEDENADEDALQLPSYLLNAGESKPQADEKDSI